MITLLYNFRVRNSLRWSKPVALSCGFHVSLLLSTVTFHVSIGMDLSNDKSMSSHVRVCSASRMNAAIAI